MNGPRLGVATALSCCAVAVLPASAVHAGARPGPSERVPEPEVVCAFTDDRLDEVSGLAARDGDVYAVNDGGTGVEVFVLDDGCAVRDVLRHPTDPYDVEDLALGPDGNLWLGDTGDNGAKRETVALHKVPPQGANPPAESRLYRLTYPDGAPDAEALLVDESGTPYIITKDVLGPSSVYRPAGPLTEPGPTPLEEVGTVSYTPTGTPGGPVGSVGSMLVTGAALAPDASVLAVRTYTDAYLYPVEGGDVLAALEKDPVRIPLPDEEQGESVTFTDDGGLLSVSEGVGSPLRVVPDATALARRAPAPDAAPGTPESPSNGTGAGGPEGTGSGGASPDDGADPHDGAGVATLPGALIAAALAAVVVVGAGRLRRR